MDAKVYAKEFETVMKNLKRVLYEFKGYNGSKSQRNSLDAYIEAEQKKCLKRGILSESDVKKCYGCVKEMIISHPKRRKMIAYLEKCIEKEKTYIETLELEEQTIDAMCAIMSVYETGNAGSDEVWEELLSTTSEESKKLLCRLEDNELSMKLHRDAIVNDLQIPLAGIEEFEKRKE